MGLFKIVFDEAVAAGKEQAAALLAKARPQIDAVKANVKVIKEEFVGDAKALMNDLLNPPADEKQAPVASVEVPTAQKKTKPAAKRKTASAVKPKKKMS